MQTLLPDALGSTRLVTDASGAVVGRSTYDAYGTQTASGTGSTFGFTGQQTDAESGLVYLRARYYDPSTGVFLQRDPYPLASNNPLTVNRYVYANNSPTTMVDPSGMSAADQVNSLSDAYDDGSDAAAFIGSVNDAKDLTSSDARARYSAECGPDGVDVCEQEAADRFISHTLLPRELNVVRDALFGIYVHIPSIKGLDEITALGNIFKFFKVQKVC